MSGGDKCPRKVLLKKREAMIFKTNEKIRLNSTKERLHTEPRQHQIFLLVQPPTESFKNCIRKENTGKKGGLGVKKKPASEGHLPEKTHRRKICYCEKTVSGKQD